jgi:hypothetical protein
VLLLAAVHLLVVAIMEVFVVVAVAAAVAVVAVVSLSYKHNLTHVFYRMT